MALSAKAKKRLEVAMARRVEALEVSTAIDTAKDAAMTAVRRQAASQAPIGSLTGVPMTLSDAATKADLDTIQAKVDAIIAALKAAGLML